MNERLGAFVPAAGHLPHAGRAPRREPPRAIGSRLHQPSTRGGRHVAGLKPASWTYAEEFVAEDEVLAKARAHAEEVGAAAVGAGAGAALRLLASLLEARAVVEIGTGTGVSGSGCCAACAPTAS